MLSAAATAGVPLVLAFTAGLVATVNPCGFAMLPSFVSYYLGGSVTKEDGPGQVAEGLLVGLVVAAGFMAVFGSVGIVFAFGARSFLHFVPLAAVAIGSILMVLGVWLLTGRHVLIRLPRLRTPEGPGYRSMLAFGAAYAVGSLSCTLPVFVVVMGAGLAAGSAAGTVSVFLAYALGMSTILMLLCLGTATFREFVVKKVRPLQRRLDRIGGVLLVLGGGYIVYYWLSLLTGSGESGPIRFMQHLQQTVQSLLLRPGVRLWFAVGTALAITAVVSGGIAVQARRRRRSEPGQTDSGTSAELPAIQEARR